MPPRSVKLGRTIQYQRIPVNAASGRDIIKRSNSSEVERHAEDVRGVGSIPTWDTGIYPVVRVERGDSVKVAPVGDSGSIPLYGTACSGASRYRQPALRLQAGTSLRAHQES